MLGIIYILSALIVISDGLYTASCQITRSRATLVCILAFIVALLPIFNTIHAVYYLKDLI